MSTRMFCDRCGSEDRVTGTAIISKLSHGGLETETKDFCFDCRQDLREFLSLKKEIRE